MAAMLSIFVLLMHRKKSLENRKKLKAENQVLKTKRIKTLNPNQ
jgi:hypothetical protein